MKYKEDNTRWLRYLDIACVPSLVFGPRHDGQPFASHWVQFLPHHMQSEDNKHFAQDLAVLGLHWPLIDDSLNCSRQSLAFVPSLWSAPMSSEKHQLQSSVLVTRSVRILQLDLVSGKPRCQTLHAWQRTLSLPYRYLEHFATHPPNQR